MTTQVRNSIRSPHSRQPQTVVRTPETCALEHRPDTICFAYCSLRRVVWAWRDQPRIREQRLKVEPTQLS